MTTPQDKNYAIFELAGQGPVRNHFAVSKTGLNPGDAVVMKSDNEESTDLAHFIKLGDDGFVRHINLIMNNSAEEDPDEPDCHYAYRINVTAAGPSKGQGKLIFLDRTGDYYALTIYAHSEKSHYVRYNSENPTIVAILWSDDA